MCLFHKWEIINAKRYTATYKAVWERDYSGETDVTLLLYKCKKCGKLKTEELEGAWTIEDLKMEKQ